MVERIKKTATVNIFRHLSQLIIGIVIARQLGVEDKGLHFVFTSIAAAIAILGSYGLINSIVFHSKKKQIGAKQVFFYVMIGLFILLLTCGVLYLIGSHLLTEMLFDKGRASNEVLWLFAIYIISSLLNYFVNSFCLAFGKMSLYFFCFAFSSIASFVIVGIGAIFYGFSIVDCLTVIVISESLCGLISFLIICNGDELNDVEDTKGIREIFGYAIKSYLGVSGSTVIGNGDSFILSTVFTQELLGLYSIAKTLYRLFAIVPQTVNSAIFGVLCDLELREAALLVKKMCVGLVLLFLSAFLISLFILEDVIIFVWGDDFSVAYHPAIILMFAATLMASTAPINPFLLTQNKPLWSSQVTLVSGVVGLITCSVMAVYMGLVGAAISVFISAIITSIMRIFYYKKFSI